MDSLSLEATVHPSASAEANSGKHIVILVHGIRTFGDWQNRLEVLIKSREPKAEVHAYKYRYFSAFAFLVPPLRVRVVKKFSDYLSRYADSWHDARVDIVAHSFGTYIVACALAASKGAPGFHTVILSGSVLKVTFPWDEIIGRGATVKRVINDCGTRDIWPLIAQMLVFGMGISGRYGFVGATGPDVGLVNRFFSFGHSGFFTATHDYPSENRFMEDRWRPLLMNDAPPEGPSLVPPKARWFAGVEYAAEPLKMILVLLICLGLYLVYRSVEDDMIGANTKASLAEARSLIEKNPIQALLLTDQADRFRRSTEARELKQQILCSIDRQAARHSSYYRRWSPSGFGSKGYFRAEKMGEMGDISADGNLILIADHEDVKLINKPDLEASRTIDATCETSFGPSRLSPSALRFSRSGARILVARQAFIFVYDVEGKLLAKTCHWYTKDQWNYLELFKDDSLLLASANQGQIMFFEIRSGDGAGSLYPLTGEFDHFERSGGAIVSLDASKDSNFMLSTHHLGSAFFWRFETEPKPRLIKIKELGAPPSRRPTKAQFAIKLSKSDEEFITSATMSDHNGETFFLTTYKAGPATQWRLVQDDIKEVRSLAHGKTTVTVIYGAFSADGSKMVTVADDRSLKIWDTVGGDILAEEQGTMPPTPRKSVK